MNQITDPDKLSNRQVRHKLAAVAPFILIADIVAALVIYYMRNELFETNADFLAGMIALFLIITGIFSFFILKIMSKKLTMQGKMKDNSDKPVE